MPTATPYSAVNKNSYGMKKTWVLYSSLIPSSGSGKPVSEDKQPVSPRHEIIYTNTTPIIYNNIKGGYRDIKSPTWTFRLRYLLIVLKSLPDFQLQKINVRKRPFLMSWRWCLHEALPYAHQTNMS